MNELHLRLVISVRCRRRVGDHD